MFDLASDHGFIAVLTATSTNNTGSDAFPTANSAGDAPARLLSAAGPMFAAKGFDRATLREIAAEAGTNVAAISYHFGDKLGLYRAVWTHIRASRESRFPAPDFSDADVSADDVIAGLVQTMLSRMLTTDGGQWQHQVLMREMQQPSPVFPEIVNEYFRPLYERLTNALKRLMGPSADETAVHRMALSVVGQCLYYRTSDRVLDVLMSEAQIRELTDIPSLATHITQVTLAAVKHGTLGLGERDEVFCSPTSTTD